MLKGLFGQGSVAIAGNYDGRGYSLCERVFLGRDGSSIMTGITCM